eukprot:scaffold41313_cov53-Attheya_sp.AAC.2
MIIRHGIRRRMMPRGEKKGEKKVNWRGLEDTEVRNHFENTAENLIFQLRIWKGEGEIVTVEELNDCINKAGATAADYLIPAIDIRNEAFQKWSSDPTEPNRENYKTKRNELNRLKRQAIGRWMKKIASKCDESHIEANPKRAWEVIREIQEGLQGHHCSPQIMKMELPDGSLAINDKQNADVFEPHSTKVFNRDDATVDFTVVLLDRIEQRSMKMHLDHPPTGKEIEKHIQKATRDKAGGESTITGRAIKALGLISKQAIEEIFTAFWHGDSDYKE